MCEFVGTFILVFAGTGAVVINALTHSLTLVGISIVFGLTLTALIYAFGHISGGHFNGAVTIGFLIQRTLSLKEGILYLVAQLLGAVVGSTSLLFLFGNTANLGTPHPLHSWQQSFFLEGILTFILMMIILGSGTDSKAVKPLAGLAIGGTLGLTVMLGGSISGGAINPTRALAPAIVSGHVNGIWIYLVSTTAGAAAASLVYKLIHQEA